MSKMKDYWAEENGIYESNEIFMPEIKKKHKENKNGS